MENLFTLKSTQYSIKIENFEGPLDLLCHLIDINKMDIYDISISDITDQYIAYINAMQEMNLEIASEFIEMASTLLYLKSRKLLPDKNNEDEVISEDELLQRIIKYKQYKEAKEMLSKLLENNGNVIYGIEQSIELPNQNLEESHNADELEKIYRSIIERNETRLNKKAGDIEKIAITENYSITQGIRTMFRELFKKPKFVFNKLFSFNKCSNEQVVTAFSGLLEMSRRSKVETYQEALFEDIYVTRKERNNK